MLTNEVMGAFCLGVVWLNTLLIVMQVLQAERALARERSALGNVVHAKVLGTDAPSLAELRIAQMGRAITTGGPRRILFTDVSSISRLHAGTIEGGLAIEPVESARVWWLGQGGERREKDFDASYSQADTSRGLGSELVVALGAPGSSVWIAGEGEPLRARVVSDRDPRVTLASGRRRAVLFVFLALSVLGGITALALVRPWFTGWSTLGGMLAVAYFLAVQPLAVALRESIAPPDQRKIGGLWSA